MNYIITSTVGSSTQLLTQEKTLHPSRVSAGTEISSGSPSS